MVIRPARFNIFLFCLALLSSAVGCRSPEGPHANELAVIRIHLEVNPDSLEMSEAVPVYRANPTMVNVNRDPFLSENNVAGAKVIVDALGGFALMIQFDQRGIWIMEQVSSTNPGKRFAIYAEFGAKPVERRWLGAPVVARRVANGVLAFTPDATRDEADQIARGLNNVAIKNGNQPKPEKSKPEPK